MGVLGGANKVARRCFSGAFCVFSDFPQRNENFRPSGSASWCGGGRRCCAARGGGTPFPQHPVRGAGQHAHGRRRRGVLRRPRVRGWPGGSPGNAREGPFWPFRPRGHAPQALRSVPRPAAPPPAAMRSTDVQCSGLLGVRSRDLVQANMLHGVPRNSPQVLFPGTLPGERLTRIKRGI